MKKIISFFLLFLSINSFAGDAIVIVFQAPLLKEPRIDSEVRQYLRKGDRVYIPNEILRNLKQIPEFFQTLDRAGNTVYIPSKFIKPITHDDREKLTNISIGSYDPTDYRLEEPIPATYPFSNNSYLKASFSFSLGSNIKSPYNYNKVIDLQDYSTEKGGKFIFLRRISFDNYDRFYFGGMVVFSSSTNLLRFTDTTLSGESRSAIRVGPMISFDSIKTEDFRLTVATGFTYNYHRAWIKRVGLNDSEEERFFNGFSFSPFITSYMQFENFFKSFDLITGAELNLYSPHTLKASSGSTVAELWNGDDLREDMKPQANVFIGTQFKY